MLQKAMAYGWDLFSARNVNKYHNMISALPPFGFAECAGIATMLDLGRDRPLTVPCLHIIGMPFFK